MKSLRIHRIDPARVKVFVHRERDAEEWQRIVADIKKRGQIHPAEVRDIRHLPAEERQRPEGGTYDFGLIAGEGRTLAARALGRPLMAFIKDAREVDVAGMFLAENLNREPLPWMQKAQLLRPLFDAGLSAEDIAERHTLTPGHVRKLKRILDKTKTGLESEVAAMPMNDAELLTALPQSDQAIVMEVFRETKDSQIRDLVKRARKVSEDNGGQLSKRALLKSLERVGEQLRRVRERMKVVRLHWSNGVQTLQLLLADRKMRAALTKAEIPFANFERITSES